MQVTRRKRCQLRTRPRKKACRYGARVSGATIYIYAHQNPLTGFDPMGLANSGAARPPTKQPSCFNFDVFANYIREHAFDAETALATLTADLAVGTMPKTPGELRGLGVPKDQLNPYTGQPSRWAARTGNRAFRDWGRSVVGRAAGGAATAAVVLEGFYDWGVILGALNEATKPEACTCKNN